MLDLDGVLANTPKQVLKYIRQDYGLGLNTKLSELTHYNFEECIPGLTFDMLEKIFMKPDFWIGIESFIHTEFLSKILQKDNTEVHILTDRRWFPSLEKITKGWLKYKAGFDYKKLVICKGKEKGEYIASENINYVVEDNIKNIIYTNNIPKNKYCTSILMDWPYNRNFEAENVIRCQNYKQIMEVINGNYLRYWDYTENDTDIDYLDINRHNINCLQLCTIELWKQ